MNSINKIDYELQLLDLASDIVTTIRYISPENWDTVKLQGLAKQYLSLSDKQYKARKL